MISRLVIDNFQSYMSFTMANNVLSASTLSILDGIHKFTKVSFKIIKVKDKRKTKYAPTTEQQRDDNSSITGPRSKKTLLSRVQLTQVLSPMNQLIISPKEPTQDASQSDAQRTREVLQRTNLRHPPKNQLGPSRDKGPFRGTPPSTLL